jgi:hypothetical protein
MRSTALLLPLALTALPFLACSSDKDHAERNATPEAQGRHPDYLNMTSDQLKAQCVGACDPDPGSRLVDVAAVEAGYQFAWLWDLDPLGKDGGLAKSTYTYDDNTTFFAVPIRTPSVYAPAFGGWEPPSDVVPPSPAGPKFAVRFKGGPFTEYGGGFGQSMRTTTNGDDRVPLLAQTPSAEFPDPTAGAYDLSGWQGLAIWVRRGPDGQSTMRLGITERNSGEDLNSSAITATGVAEGKYCRRWRICGCSAGTPCSPVQIGQVTQFRCFDPALGPPPDGNDRFVDVKWPVCGTTRCQQPNTSTAMSDPLFADRSCSAGLEADGHSDMFCYDPGKDPAPPAKRERCGNPYSRPITVSTDWQLIKVPFSELRQADEAKVSDEMDLHSVKQFVVTYSGGWTDFWVANIGFYRKQ